MEMDPLVGGIDGRDVDAGADLVARRRPVAVLERHAVGGGGDEALEGFDPTRGWQPSEAQGAGTEKRSLQYHGVKVTGSDKSHDPGSRFEPFLR